ncbi:MAG: CoA-binding protein, partial [Bacteroidia bacterium]|nr:CoA-binding protein [Bacteroidia bacterium]
YKASVMLAEYHHEVYPFGLKAGSIQGKSIETIWPEGETFDTVTLYVGPQNQDTYIPKILALKPKRVVFNPGTENPDFEQKLEEAGIEALEACTLVMLRTGQY